MKREMIIGTIVVLIALLGFVRCMEGMGIGDPRGGGGAGGFSPDASVGGVASDAGSEIDGSTAGTGGTGGDGGTGGSDLCAAVECDPNATCEEGTCACNPGYIGDGFTCDEEHVCPNGACSSVEDVTSCPQDCDHDLAVIIEASLVEPLQSSLAQYLSDLRHDGLLARVQPWAPGNAAALRTLIDEQVEDYGVQGALLVGNLPAAWYEQCIDWDLDPETPCNYEEFPLDIYLQDRGATWTDEDDDGILDSHSELELDTFTSRLMGSAPELRLYFERLHDYRTEGSLLEPSAFVFKDDSWPSANTYDLDRLYTDVELLWQPADSTMANYIERLTGRGAEFVYQAIHSTTNRLTFIHNLPPGAYIGLIPDPLRPGFVLFSSLDLKVSFVTMFNCSAARFTEPNLGMAYAVQTEYGLATIGTAKVGGVYAAGIFHDELAVGRSWGESYRRWYNEFGKVSDRASLGIVIMGDPLLTVSGDAVGLVAKARAPLPTPEEIEELSKIFEDVAATTELGTFRDYQLANPQFFED